MGKRTGDLYECDRSSCDEQAFVARAVSRDGTTGREIATSSTTPSEWTSEGQRWFCPECSKSYQKWLDGKITKEGKK